MEKLKMFKKKLNILVVVLYVLLLCSSATAQEAPVDVGVAMIIYAVGPYHGDASPEKVIDGDLNSIWNPIGPGRYFNNWYIKFELDTSYVVTRVQLVNYGDRTHDLTSFKLEASTDNRIYYMGGNKDGVTVGSSEWQSFDGFAATGKYLKFNITSTYSGWQPYLKEIRFAGYPQDEFCSGEYTSAYGIITHPLAGPLYHNNEHCVWIIYSSRKLYFRFSQFSTEKGYDYLIAHDGNSIGSPIIARLSGESRYRTFTTVGDAYLRFVSDESEVGSGFILHWSIKFVGPKPTEGCNCDYSTFSSSHTMNKYTEPDQLCGAYTKTVVTDDEIKTILKTHNELREKVAKGLETKGSPGPQPSAKNMLELKWNCELAEVARKWAERCDSGHDANDDRKICNRDYYVGQNKYGPHLSYSAESEWEDAINRWYREVKDMPKSNVERFERNPSGATIGHYSQVVWAETYEVGCGGIDIPVTRGGRTYPRSKLYVCNYGGGGNYPDRKIYEDGEAASNCPNGASSDYPGLCAWGT